MRHACVSWHPFLLKLPSLAASVDGEECARPALRQVPSGLSLRHGPDRLRPLREAVLCGVSDVEEAPPLSHLMRSANRLP